MLQNQQRDTANAGEEKDEIVTREKGEVGQRRKGLGKEEEVRKWARISETKGENYMKNFKQKWGNVGQREQKAEKRGHEGCGMKLC